MGCAKAESQAFFSEHVPLPCFGKAAKNLWHCLCSFCSLFVCCHSSRSVFQNPLVFLYRFIHGSGTNLGICFISVHEERQTAAFTSFRVPSLHSHSAKSAKECLKMNGTSGP